MSDQEFDDVEVQRILQRAAEQQKAAERTKLARGSGTSLASLREIASEVGIDPRFVEAAAREVSLDRSEPEAKEILGVPRSILRRRIVPGTFTEDEWARVVAELRRTFGVNGVVSSIGSTREWATGVDPSNVGLVTRATLEPVEGGTMVTMTHNADQVVTVFPVLGGTFTGVAAVLGGLALFLGSAPPLVAIAAIFLVLSVALVAIGVPMGKAHVDKRTRMIDSAIDRIELLARSSEGE